MEVVQSDLAMINSYVI